MVIRWLGGWLGGWVPRTPRTHPPGHQGRRGWVGSSPQGFLLFSARIAHFLDPVFLDPKMGPLTFPCRGGYPLGEWATPPPGLKRIPVPGLLGPAWPELSCQGEVGICLNTKAREECNSRSKNSWPNLQFADRHAWRQQPAWCTVPPKSSRAVLGSAYAPFFALLRRETYIHFTPHPWGVG